MPACRHGTWRGNILMDFRLPLPRRCRESRKRKWAAGAMSCRLWLCSGLIVVRALSATGEAIALIGLAEAAGGGEGGGEGGETLVEGGGGISSFMMFVLKATRPVLARSDT